MNYDAESNRLDVTALQIIDPQFYKLHGTASQVAVYRFNSGTQSWDRTDTVGCMFLYERSVQPQYGLCVMNRTTAGHFIQKFGADAKFAVDQPYILIRAMEDLQTDPRESGSDTHSIWFREPQDCIVIANMLRNMWLKVEGEKEGDTFDKMGQISKFHLDDNSPTRGGKGNVLLKMLRQRKNTYLEKKIGPDMAMAAGESEY